MTISPGTHVLAKAADGQELPRRAVTDVIDGEDFPVVWVTTEDEWESAEAEGRRPEAWPWPAEDVQPVALA
jgi:hypothetical protein